MEAPNSMSKDLWRLSFGGALAPSICLWQLNCFDKPIHISIYCTVGPLLIALCVIKPKVAR